MKLSESVPVEKLVAKVVQIGQEMQVSQEFLDTVRVNRYEDEMWRRAIYSIAGYLLASGEEKVECNIQWPENWIEAVKERWAPKWLLARWPVIYKTHHVDRTFYRAMCPHIEIPRNQGKEVHFHFLKEHDINEAD